MQYVRTNLFSLASWAFSALLLAACGGGSGGGSGSGGEPPLAASVRLTNVSYSSNNVQVFENLGRLPGLSIQADLAGDLTRLNGKTIYVVVVDPDGLYEPTPSLQLGAGGLGNQLLLQGKPTAGRAGQYRGTLQVNVCVDAKCVEPVGGSPLQIPYDVAIVAGATFGTKAPLTVEVAFGDPPSLAPGVDTVTERTVPVTLFANNLNVTLSTPATASGSPPFFGLALGSDGVRIGFFDAPPGTYTGSVQIETTAILNGTAQTAVSSLPIQYTVRPVSGVLAVFRPSRIDLSGSSPIDVKLVAADGKAYTGISRIVYVTDTGGVQWLSGGSRGTGSGAMAALFSFSASYCVSSGFPNCLGAGARYDANVYFRTADGTELSQPLPVTLTAR